MIQTGDLLINVINIYNFIEEYLKIYLKIHFLNLEIEDQKYENKFALIQKVQFHLKCLTLRNDYFILLDLKSLKLFINFNNRMCR